MSNVINLLEHPKFLNSRAPSNEADFSQWTDKLTSYFQNQPVMTFHFDPFKPTGPELQNIGLNSLLNEITEEDTTPDYLIVMDLLEDCIKDGNYRSAKAAVEMLDDIVERIVLKKTLDNQTDV